MANEVRATSAGVYAQVGGSQNLAITSAGVYIQLNESGDMRVTSAGVYVQGVINTLNVSSVGTYIQLSPPETLSIFFKFFEVEKISKISVQQTVSVADATALTDSAKIKLPILPDWTIAVEGFWTSGLANLVGDLSSQEPSTLVFTAIDRFDNAVTLTNNEAFIIEYTTDINIDNVKLYRITFAGSGTLVST